MTTVLVYSDASANLAKVLDIGNFSWKAIDDVAAAGEFEPVKGWDGAVITVNDDTPEVAFDLARTLRGRENAETLVAVDPIGADVGERVLVVFGRAARHVIGRGHDIGFQSAVCGIVDGMDLEGGERVGQTAEGDAIEDAGARRGANGTRETT